VYAVIFGTAMHQISAYYCGHHCALKFTSFIRYHAVLQL
jgi:hypothetical protein